MASIEQLQERRDRRFALLQRAQAEFKSANEALIRAQKVQEAKQVMGLKLALETYVASGWHERGEAYLSNLSHRGAWKDSGLRSGMGHFKNNQNILTLTVKKEFTSEQLEHLADLIEEVVPLMRDGALDGTLKLTSKGSSVEAKTLKIFTIQDHSRGYQNYRLGWIADHEWVVFDEDALDSSWERARFTGTLREALEEIQNFSNIEWRGIEE